jgi:WD40 repeat protein
VVAAHHDLSFYPYGAAFQDSRTAWLVGSHGAVARIDIPTGSVVEVTERSPYVGHFYDVAVLEDGDLVITGGEGSVRRCRPEAGRPTLLTRHTKIDYGGFEPVPDTADLRLNELWITRRGSEDVLFCDVSPDGPMVAVGLAGGDVHALDLRDGAPAGKWPSRLDDMSLQGVAFAGDGTLAVLHGDGAVTLARPI